MITTPSAGQTNWDVPLNAVLEDLDTRIEQISFNVKDFGAVGDGATDDTTAIQTAIDDSPSGGIVYLPPGEYAVTAPIRLHPTITLLGPHGSHLANPAEIIAEAFIKPLASFSGTQVIEMVDQATGGYSALSALQRIINLTIDGGDAPASVDGIRATGYVHGVQIRNVGLRDMTGRGVATITSGSDKPFSWRMTNVIADNPGGIGFSFSNLTDSTLIDCQTIGAGSHGFFLVGMANSQMIGCRSEFSSFHGYYFSSSWGTGTGSGGLVMSGCSTDRNERNGVFVDATGNTPLCLSGLLLRRDGRNANAGGGGFAGLRVAGATVPVLVDNITVYPGVDDNGSGTNSPQYGATFLNATYVNVDSGFLHANTAGWNDEGGNTELRRGPNIGERTGSTSAPTDVFNQLIDFTDLTTIDFQPVDHGALAWTHDPANNQGASALTSGTLYLARIQVRQTTSVTTVGLGIGTAGSGLTAGQNFAGLYNSAGTLVATSADQTTAWGTVGYKAAAITASVTPGFYYIAILSNGTTPPQFLRATTQSTSTLNFNLASGTERFLSFAGAGTTLPASVTLGSGTAESIARWGALI